MSQRDFPRGLAVPEPELDELYRDLLLDHNRRPRNRRPLEAPTAHAEGLNPVCGDEITLDLRIEDETLSDIGFGGRGCLISQASASLMTERVRGRSIAEAEDVIGSMRGMMNGTAGAGTASALGDLEALQGVARFPVRVRCALLCWNVLEQGLQQWRAQQPNAPN